MRITCETHVILFHSPQHFASVPLFKHLLSVCNNAPLSFGRRSRCIATALCTAACPFRLDLARTARAGARSSFLPAGFQFVGATGDDDKGSAATGCFCGRRNQTRMMPSSSFMNGGILPSCCRQVHGVRRMNHTNSNLFSHDAHLFLTCNTSLQHGGAPHSTLSSRSSARAVCSFRTLRGCGSSYSSPTTSRSSRS